MFPLPAYGLGRGRTPGWEPGAAAASWPTSGLLKLACRLKVPMLLFSALERDPRAGNTVRCNAL